eukprot:GFKZ01006676.1.p1 GENE.GFKZ01006676.1~~GFKZ01006676.1.p1  ORF type:complete len:1248 (-),score=355.77 GFKZ01006676.1:1435-5178(-)
MDDDLFEFEAPPEAAPQLILGKKKKKKKKKDASATAPVETKSPVAEHAAIEVKDNAVNGEENGGSHTASNFAALLPDDDLDENGAAAPSTAYAALDMDDDASQVALNDRADESGDEDGSQLTAAVPSKKKKKKKKKDLILEPLDQQDEVEPVASPGSPQANGGNDHAGPDDLLEFVEAPSVPSKKKKKKKKAQLVLGPLQEDVSVEDQAPLDLQAEAQQEPPAPSEPAADVKRPMTAAEKKKAKKERERLAKLEKAKKEQDELDAILAELGDGNPPQVADASSDNVNENANHEATPMTAAQKKRAKKKKKAAAEKEDDPEIDALLAELDTKEAAPQVGTVTETKESGDVDDLLAELAGDTPAAAKKKPKKKKKKGGAKGEEEGGTSTNAESVAQVETKKPKKKESAAVRRMREQREKMLAEEERIRKEKEAEEARIAEEERIRLEEIHRKETEKAKKKAAEKAKKERKRKEGTLLSKAEKERRRKAEMFRKQLEEQGMIPAAGTSDRGDQANKPKRVVYDRKKKTRSVNSAVEQKEIALEEGDKSLSAQPEKSTTPEPEPEVIPDAWDDLPDLEKSNGNDKKDDADEEAAKEDNGGARDEDSESEDSDDSDGSEYEGMTKAEIAAEKRLDALRRERHKMREDAKSARTADHLRSPIICILGHVDTGKTKILDRIRKTNVQDGEAGGITQQIGATYFPIEAVKKEATKLQEGKKLEYNVPSLLIIDTPGHESFTNLRSRGSSLCDIAILVIDIMHGLEPQTKESIDLLKLRKTPFIIALNKIDRIYDWDAQPHNCPTRDSLAKQPRHAREEFERRVRETKLELAEIGFNTELYWENQDVRKFVSIVPTSAISGEGIPDLLMLLLALPQRLLTERLMFSPILEATVLEVKVIEGLGTTIDIVLTGGTIREGDTIMVVGLDGPIVTTIRALLTPHPMKEMRVKGQYLHHKEIKAAQGIKISADNLEKAVAGTQLMVVEDPANEDEMSYVRDEVMKDFKTILTSVDKSGLGVYVQASTLGSLEALLEFLRTSKIPVSGINIGPVHKRDVTKASTMLERRKEYATILAFDVGVEKEARELSEDVGVKIFTADIIYHLFDQFTAYMEEMKRRRREDVNDDVVFPSICKILPQHIYNKKDPIVLGVDVMEGILRVGTPLVVRHGNGWLDVGRVASLELNKKQVITARKGESVAVKIQGKTTEHIMYGRHFDFQDELVSKMSRSAIDLLKENFRDDLGKEEWLLVIKLKKRFDII